MNGILVVDKPQGFTSFDVVAKLRGICRTKKIGHSGTLDPMATGVLPIFIGRTAKAVDLQPRQDKAYEAEICFGLATDTGDITGEVLQRGPHLIDKEELLVALSSFQGEREQVPPMYSAVKVNGKPLYRYAREGKEVQRKARKVVYHSIRFLEQSAEDRFRIAVHCSKGTYIRVLAQELGQALGSCATLSALRRTAAGVFTLQEAKTLDEIQSAKENGVLEQLLQPLDGVFQDIPSLQIEPVAVKRLLNGAPVYGVRAQASMYRLYEQEMFLGLGTVGQDGCLKAQKLFMERDNTCS